MSQRPGGPRTTRSPAAFRSEASRLKTPLAARGDGSASTIGDRPLGAVELNVGASSSSISRHVKDAGSSEQLDAGVRADTSTVWFSRSGEVLTPPLSQRMIGITGEQLRRIPEVVAVAGGADKADAGSRRGRCILGGEAAVDG
jgi:Putative sugar-binding domain